MSRTQLNNLLIGLTLIGAGIFYLLINMGIVSEPAPQTWTLLFAAASLYFFVCYFITGIQNWGWLFPAFIGAGIAGTIWLSEITPIDKLVAIPVLAGVALPFLAIFFLDRKNWWALIPFYVLTVVIGIVLFAESLPGEMIAAFVLWSIAFPFLIVYLNNRQNNWALIPAGILAGVGLIPLLSTMFQGEDMGAMVLFVIALPFFVIYLLSVNNWWALIPAGILTSIGLGIFLIGSINGDQARVATINGVIFLGWGITFGILWLRRSVHPTSWAIYPSAGLLAIGVLAFITRSDINQYWPFVIIVIGVYLLARGIFGRK